MSDIGGYFATLVEELAQLLGPYPWAASELDQFASKCDEFATGMEDLQRVVADQQETIGHLTKRIDTLNVISEERFAIYEQLEVQIRDMEEVIATYKEDFIRNQRCMQNLRVLNEDLELTVETLQRDLEAKNADLVRYERQLVALMSPVAGAAARCRRTAADDRPEELLRLVREAGVLRRQLADVGAHNAALHGELADMVFENGVLRSEQQRIQLQEAERLLAAVGGRAEPGGLARSIAEYDSEDELPEFVTQDAAAPNELNLREELARRAWGSSSESGLGESPDDRCVADVATQTEMRLLCVISQTPNVRLSVYDNMPADSRFANIPKRKVQREIFGILTRTYCRKRRHAATNTSPERRVVEAPVSETGEEQPVPPPGQEAATQTEIVPPVVSESSPPARNPPPPPPRPATAIAPATRSPTEQVAQLKKLGFTYAQMVAKR